MKRATTVKGAEKQVERASVTTLKANLSGFPCNSGWVGKQARDTVWKRLRGKPKSWESSLKAGSKARREGEIGTVQLEEEVEKSGVRITGQTIFQVHILPFRYSDPFRYSNLSVRLLTQPAGAREQWANTPYAVPTHDTTAPLHASAHPPPYPVHATNTDLELSYAEGRGRWW